MSFTALYSLGEESPLRIQLIAGADPYSLDLAGLLQPLRLAAAKVGPQRLELSVTALEQVLQDGAQERPYHHVSLLVAEHERLPQSVEARRRLLDCCQHAQVWGAVGGAVLWLAQCNELQGVRTALSWHLYPELTEVAEGAVLTPRLFELDGNRLTCCGGSASIDFGLALVEAFCGATVQAEVQELMCLDRVRGAEARQRLALRARFGQLQPKLAEAVTLMEANLEEPLTTDDIANLVGISRRQLERQFKQFLGSVPSRYYLELRLQKARQLLLSSHHSIVQVGLICGFSSSSHFSTAYGALFGLTPRDERQRKLAPEMDD